MLEPGFVLVWSWTFAHLFFQKLNIKMCWYSTVLLALRSIQYVYYLAETAEGRKPLYYIFSKIALTDILFSKILFLSLSYRWWFIITTNRDVSSKSYLKLIASVFRKQLENTWSFLCSPKWLPTYNEPSSPVH